MNCLRLFRALQQRSTLTFRISAAKYATYNPVKFSEVQDRWRQTDGMSKQWQLVYKAPMDKWLNYMSLYLTITSGAVTAGAIYYAAFLYDETTKNAPVIIGQDVVIANSGIECLVYLGAYVAFHVALKVFLSKYVIRLYQNGDNYMAIFRGNWLNSIKKHKFRLDEFKKLKPTLIVTWGDSRFALGKKHGILLEDYFKTPQHFNYLLYKNKSDIEE